MPSTSIYSASLTQLNNGPITASFYGKPTLEGTWSRLSSGSYALTVSGSSVYTLGTSGSISGSISVALSHYPYTGSMRLYIPAYSTSSLYIETFVGGINSKFADNSLPSSCSVDIIFTT
jgi:protoheme ferro-lyase